MIDFKNGYTGTYFTASGALGFDGKGWWFEQPWKWLGLLKPQEFINITKTLTFYPIKGNLNHWKPWQAVQFLENQSVINAVGETNPGLMHWIEHIFPRMKYAPIVSVDPGSQTQAIVMAKKLNCLNLIALQLNYSCPNIQHHYGRLNVARSLIKASHHPVIVKLSYQDDYVNICKQLQHEVVAFELINSVPFNTIFPKKHSPLKPLEGAVSGRLIAPLAREALKKVKEAGIKTPIMSGGGIDSFKEAEKRFELGAEGIVFGSIFLRKPWLPNQIVREYTNY